MNLLFVFLQNFLLIPPSPYIANLLKFPPPPPLALPLTVMYHHVFCNVRSKFLSCNLILLCHLRLVMKVVFSTLI